MRPATLFVLVTAVAMATPPVQALAASGGEIDVPITQSIIRDGVIRYGVWVEVGERSVLAMLDTGSTGLRIMPSVFRGEPRGTPTEVSFGSGARLRGVAVPMPIAIGSRTGVALVEVVQEADCVETQPHCDVERRGGGAYLIGGDGFSSEGYSAILGIGLPFRGTDVGHPLTALGITRWIVDLPRPYALAEGHLILDPEPRRRNGFDMLERHGFADGDACVQAAPLAKETCGSVLFDTGAPAVSVSFEGIKTATAWPKGTPGAFSFKSGGRSIALDFTSGRTGGLVSAMVSPPAPRDPPGAFILAGVEPYFTYDLLYESETHGVGLKKRATPFHILDPVEDGEEGRADDTRPPVRRKHTHG